MEYKTGQLGSRAILWMQGLIHNRPPTRGWHEDQYVNSRRHSAFISACMSGDLNIEVWPEFKAGVSRLGLRPQYEAGTLSPIVLGLLIVDGRCNFGSWRKRATRLRRQGKNPLKRRRYVRAERMIYHAIFKAREIAKRNTFEQLAAREMAKRA